MFNGNIVHTVANNLCIIFSSICLILYNNTLTNFKQVNLPYRAGYFSQCVTINQDFLLYNLKMSLFPSFIFYPNSDIPATHLICLILSLVYIKTYPQTLPLQLVTVRILPKSKEFSPHICSYFTFTGEKYYEVLSGCLSLHIFMFTVPT